MKARFALEIWLEKSPQGLKPDVELIGFFGTTEVVPWYKAILGRLPKLCRPECRWYPTHSAGRRGMDGAHEFTVNPEMLKVDLTNGLPEGIVHHSDF